MNKLSRAVFSGFVCALAGVAATYALAFSPTEKDPAAWYADDATPRAQYETAKKEADAALREALVDCREMRGKEKIACTKEAKATHAKDLQDAKKLLGKS